MKYRKLDENGDYSFGADKNNYLSGVEAIAQAIKTKILLFYGEWWEDISIGIPMFQSLIGQMDSEALKISSSLLLSKRIKEVEEVISVDEVNANRVKRRLNFNVAVTTTDGQTTVEVNV